MAASQPSIYTVNQMVRYQHKGEGKIYVGRVVGKSTKTTITINGVKTRLILAQFLENFKCEIYAVWTTIADPGDWLTEHPPEVMQIQ